MVRGVRDADVSFLEDRGDAGQGAFLYADEHELDH